MDRQCGQMLKLKDTLVSLWQHIGARLYILAAILSLRSHVETRFAKKQTKKKNEKVEFLPSVCFVKVSAFSLSKVDGIVRK